MSGIEIAKKLAAVWKEVKILAVSAHSNDAYVKSMVAAGAKGYLLKDNASNELKTAIEAVMRGESWFGQRTSHNRNAYQPLN